MSYRSRRKWLAKGVDLNHKSEQETHELFLEVLEEGLHGLCYSAYEDGQQPGSILTESQIRRRMAIIAPHTEWVRSFSCIEGNELIPVIAREFGLKTLVGAWLGKDESLNEQEIAGLIKLAKAGYVDIAAVGNEVLYREDLTEAVLLNYINRVKTELPGVPVGYVDAYYEFSMRPEITAACDIILANCYPYWEGSHIDYSFIHIKQMYYQALHAGKGKQVIITETGWPSQGTGLDDAAPSKLNALKYFLTIQQWVAENNIDLFYFSSFDESWKVGGEGDVGAYWGLWDKNEQLKF
ncbi:glycoside hydrolase family 17 protein [Flavilitoribacter nigricans]|uniref:Endo-1,3-beta-glucanase btgC n=1 Tax=Flavilitoribacter nigricans (strain ATCC 23147 / DSM 23189 / NBRC 102662 / NCIMB 1420 / SS-2) TaxID=1122177 RepID=A0A2D0N343_FLAN2|nr:glycosyl hydrolase family 17 protein [Flavilitoribacter nigricans]PHN02924.1 glycosyl hydrolase [Flavilitoribacter nigricans DSM 23189 = NBRC 102662]